MQNIWLILIGWISYLIGSIPTAYLITRYVSGKVVWLEGSGNVGAMNVYRATGSTKLMILATALDIGKGALAILLTQWLGFLGYNPGFGIMTTAFFLVLGHNYSLFLRFRGGRGLASFLGVLLVVNPLTAPACLGVLIVTILTTEYRMRGQLEWSRRNIFSILGSQILGRVIGLAFCLIPIYFLAQEAFLHLLPGILLAFPRHVSRVRAYLSELKEHGNNA